MAILELIVNKFLPALLSGEVGPCVDDHQPFRLPFPSVVGANPSYVENMKGDALAVASVIIACIEDSSLYTGIKCPRDSSMDVYRLLKFPMCNFFVMVAFVSVVV